jgi:hypothetical protein
MQQMGSILASSEGHCRALGLITANFAVLEEVTAAMVWSLCGSDIRVGQIVTAELSYARIRAVLSSLLRVAFPSVEMRAEWESVLARATEAEQKRNIYIHSLWTRSEDGVISRWKSTAKERSGLVHQNEPVTVEQLQVVAEFIARVTNDLLELSAKLSKLERANLPQSPK